MHLSAAYKYPIFTSESEFDMICWIDLCRHIINGFWFVSLSRLSYYLFLNVCHNKKLTSFDLKKMMMSMFLIYILIKLYCTGLYIFLAFII